MPNSLSKSRNCTSFCHFVYRIANQSINLLFCQSNCFFVYQIAFLSIKLLFSQQNRYFLSVISEKIVMKKNKNSPSTVVNHFAKQSFILLNSQSFYQCHFKFPSFHCLTIVLSLPPIIVSEIFENFICFAMRWKEKEKASILVQCKMGEILKKA